MATLSSGKLDSCGHPILVIHRVVISIAMVVNKVPLLSPEDVCKSLEDIVNKQRNTKSGGWVYVIGLIKPGPGGDMPWYIGETGNHKLADRLKAADEILKMRDLLTSEGMKHGTTSGLVVWAINAETLSQQDRQNLETVLIQKSKEKNPKLLNVQKKGKKVGTYSPELAIPGVNSGPLRCSGQYGSEEVRALGLMFQNTIGWK